MRSPERTLLKRAVMIQTVRIEFPPAPQVLWRLSAQRSEGAVIGWTREPGESSAARKSRPRLSSIAYSIT